MLVQHLVMGSSAAIAAKALAKLAGTLINCRGVLSDEVTAGAIGCCCDIDPKAIGYVNILIQNVCLCI